MSELQDYYDNFQSGYWANTDKTVCACRGRGWALSEVDTWHECPVHFHGQLHPDDGVFDEGTEEDIAEAEKASCEAWVARRRNPTMTIPSPPPSDWANSNEFTFDPENDIPF